MTKVTTELTGFDELQAVLRELPQAMQRRVYEGAVRRAAAIMQRAARARAPVGKDPRSAASKKYGPGRRNIRVRRWRNTKPGIVGFSVDTGRAFWLRFIEEGTRHIAARPFFRPAFDETAPASFDVMRDALLKGLEREVNRLAGKYGKVRRTLLRG